MESSLLLGALRIVRRPGALTVPNPVPVSYTHLDVYKRQRLYGAQHPQTQEAAGVRAVVHLLRGDIRQAMIDYEELFAATLDSTAGWLDLDLRGVRGYVLGIAFDEFMRDVA